MGYRIRGEVIALEYKEAIARQIGQVVGLATDGKAIAGNSGLGVKQFPLLTPATAIGSTVDVQVTGVALVKKASGVVVAAGDLMVVNNDGNAIVGVVGSGGVIASDVIGVAVEAAAASKNDVAVLL